MYIKPCPFCGGEPIINVITIASNLSYKQDYYHVACLICDIRQDEYTFKNKDDAINTWNKRKESKPYSKPAENSDGKCGYNLPQWD